MSKRKLSKLNPLGLFLAFLGFVAGIVGLFLNIWKFNVQGSENATYVGFFGEWPESFKLIYNNATKNFVGFWAIAFDVLILIVLVMVLTSILATLFLRKSRTVVSVINFIAFIAVVFALICGIVFCTTNTLNLNIATIDVSFAVGAYISLIASFVSTIGVFVIARN